MLAIREFEKRFREILDQLDEACEATGDDELEELNAEFEDALFMLAQTDPSAEDAAEEFSDALEEFEALKDDYEGIDQVKDIAARLGMLIEMARGNL